MPQIVKKAGLSSALVDQQRSGLGAITVTGWAAVLSVASLVVLTLALAGYGLWKFVGGGSGGSGAGGHRYARVMKQGDV